MIKYADSEHGQQQEATDDGRRSLQAKEADAPAAEEGAVDAVVVAALALDFQ